MKKITRFLVLMCLTNYTFAQIIDIPDTRLKQMLVSGYNVDNDDDGNLWINDVADTNDDGEIDVNEAQAVVAMRIVNNSGPDDIFDIVSLEGLQYFTNLKYLDCRHNSITSLDPISQLPLETLWCSSNPITSIDFSNLISLKDLRVQNLNLSSLDVSNLINLEKLIYNNTGIASLDIENLTNLQEIDCSNNNVTSLDFLTHLNQLRVLKFNNSSISNIDLSLFPDLEELDCGNNELTALDLTPVPYLKYLYCGNNQLTEIDVSQLANLWEIEFNDNFLTAFDSNGTNHLIWIWGQNNQLTYVNIKDGFSPGYWSFYEYNASYVFSNNPLEAICVDQGTEEVNQLSGYNLTSYCNFTPGGTYYTIEGSTYLDLDDNGCAVDDAMYSNLNFSITDGTETGSFISNVSGNYSIPVGDGTHTSTPVLENPNYFNISPTSVTVDFPTDVSPFIQDFCITPNGTFNDLEVTIFPIGVARPGFDAEYKIIYKNKGTTILSGTVDLIFQDELMDLVSANPTEDAQSLNMLSWNFTDLVPFESREIDLTMNINSPMETPPVNGDDILIFDASVSSSETDETPEDNSFTLNQTVVNSFDPNDKTCLEGNTIAPEQVGEFVHYRIRFENTGTANAINVVIKDDIDRTKYDLSSLVPIDASHDYVARIKDSAQDYYVEFIFENINLPFDDANNDGYVVFKIRTLDTLVLGDTFENDAEIYFDFNFPIITNNEQTTISTLSTEDFELADAIELYPNPTNDILHIKAKQVIKQISIYDISGRLIQKIAVIGNKTQVNISTEGLSSGPYFIKIESNANEVVRKVIKN